MPNLWMTLEYMLLMIILCVVFTWLGLWLSFSTAKQYQIWWNSRHSVKEYPQSQFNQRECSNCDKGVVESVPKGFQNDKDKESKKKAPDVHNSDLSTGV